MSLEQRMRQIRSQFPALNQKFKDMEFTYLDSTNTTLKPNQVIERIQRFYREEASNVHRGGYQWSARTTENFEQARRHVAQFLGAESSDEIVFVRGATEALNLVATTLGQAFLNEGDEVLISEMEHHANIVPWHMLQGSKGVKVKAVRIHDDGELDLEDLKSKLNSKTKVVSLTACSNTLGTITPIDEISKLVRARSDAYLVVDGAQIVTQQKVNVRDWDVDFFAFSSHKIFGPTGLGVLYGKKSILDQLPPYQGGGSMISEVTLEKTTYNEVPLRFEAGTPHIEGVIGLDEALSFVESIGWNDITGWEQVLLKEATQMLKQIPEVVIYGEASRKAPILAFNLIGAHHSDVAQILDEVGVAVRAGHHCTQPLMQRLGITGCLRASFSIYNNLSDIQKLREGIMKAKELLL